jgi:hypothetical protein
LLQGLKFLGHDLLGQLSGFFLLGDELVLNNLELIDSLLLGCLRPFVISRNSFES